MKNDTFAFRIAERTLRKSPIDEVADVAFDQASFPAHVLQEAWAFFITAAAREMDARTENPAKAQTGHSGQTGHHDHAAGHEAETLPHDFPAPHRSSLAGLNAAGSSGRDPLGAVIEGGVNTALVPTAGIGIALGDTFRLNSLPGSTYTVFLDFDGHTTAGTAWNSYFNATSFYSSAFALDGSESFNEAELLAIQQIWQRIAEFFSPFNINVTTQDPGAAALTYSGSGDNAYGIRVVITDEGGKDWGGLAYEGSFDWNSDTAAFVYANPLGDNIHYIATAAAHEIGHSLGLTHDGQGGNEYYYGHGGWAPTMGVGYYSSIVQWSNGGYSGATNTQDDLAVITTQNGGVTYRADDHGNTFATATALGGVVANGIASVQAFGVISGSGSRNDVDMFSFTLAAGGSIDLAVSGWSRAFVTGNTTPVYSKAALSMLDTKLTLYDASFETIAIWDDPTRTDGTITLGGLAGGTYYLAVDGTGWGSPTAASPTGWSEYGSLGQYMITGSYSAGSGTTVATLPQLVVDRASLATTEAGGSDSVTLRALNATGDILVGVTGLDTTEGSLSASSLLLNATNNWTATLRVSGRDDREADGAVAYSLSLGATGLGSVTVQVINADNDITPTSSGTAFKSGTTTSGGGGKKTSRSPEGAVVATLAADDGSALTITESGRSPNFNQEWRWEFAGLSAGDHRLQVDASSAGEAFRLEYSTDGAVSWRSFAGAPGNATAWNGDFLATGVSNSLWVRLVDAVRSNDSTRDSFVVDLLTLAPVVPSASSSPPGADLVLG